MAKMPEKKRKKGISKNPPPEPIFPDTKIFKEGKDKPEKKKVEKENPFIGKPEMVTPLIFPSKERILSNWFLKKHRQYFYREGLEMYSHMLAKRLLQIVGNEPDHEIAKVLRKENA